MMTTTEAPVEAREAVKKILAQLRKTPDSTAFSRLKYLRWLKPDPTVEFMNGLFIAAVEARDADDWSRVEAYLEEWEQRIEEYTQGVWYEAGFDEGFFAPLTRPLREATVALVTTGGLYLEGQEPFDVDGDHSFREIPRDALPGPYGVAHKQYQTQGALEDYNCIFALDRMKEAEAEGRIGRLAETNYAFMGYIPDWEALWQETAPEVARRLKAEGVHAAVIGTT
jgi:D-proline reductase (dithiol) PrdB